MQDDNKHPIDVELAAALEKDPSTHGQVRALERAARRWDEELNRVYRDLIAALPARARPTLRASQRAWIAFRDAERRAIAGVFGDLDGTMFQPMRAQAWLNVTRERVRTLKGYREARAIDAK